MKKEVPCLDCRGQGLISKFNEKSAWLERCQNCGGTGVITVVVTNADRIRAMSDEELLDFMKKSVANAYMCKIIRTEPMFLTLEWLQQPSEEDT